MTELVVWLILIVSHLQRKFLKLQRCVMLFDIAWVSDVSCHFQRFVASLLASRPKLSALLASLLGSDVGCGCYFPWFGAFLAILEIGMPFPVRLASLNIVSKNLNWSTRKAEQPLDDGLH